MNTQISISGLIAGFIFGVFGWFFFRKGKQNAENDLIFVGIALMVYPYFTSGPWADWIIGLALFAIAYLRPFRF